MLQNTRSVSTFVLALVLAFICSSAESYAMDVSPWTVGGGSYNFRQEITISSSLTGSDLTGYPLPVQITDASNPVFSYATGSDIVFTSDDGVTQLEREIETFTAGGTPNLTAWVKTDISSSLDTKIYMYYNGPSVADSTDTWDSNYKLVQHLQEDPTGTIFDSTSNNNDGTTSGGMTSGQQVAGQLGGALDFDGNDKVDLGTASSLYPTTLTLEAWAKTDDDTKTWQGIFTNRPSTASGLNLQMGTAQQLSSLLGDGVGGQTYVGASGTADPVAGTWYHLAVTHDGGTTARFYVNGILVDTDTRALGYIGSSPVQLGNFYSSGGNSLPFFGIIDEVRLSDTVRSADWIGAQALLVNSPGTFVTLGQVQGPVPEPSSLMLLGLGALGLVRHTRRMRHQA